MKPLNRKEFYLARMAGEDVTVPDPLTREEYYMKSIAAQIEAGSAELPAVTDVDEGKILAVNASGKWAKADAPTGMLYIGFTGNPSNPTGLTKTYSEIILAIQNGQIPVIFNPNTGGQCHYLSNYAMPIGTAPLEFQSISITASSISKRKVTLTNADVLTVETITYTPTT